MKSMYVAGAGGGVRGQSIVKSSDRIVGLTTPIGCFIGNGVYTPSCDSAYILCNGELGVQCTTVSADVSSYTMYQLKTVDSTCTNPIYSQTAYLQYYDTITNSWITINSIPVGTYYGYAYVYFVVQPNGWIGSLRISWQCNTVWQQISTATPTPTPTPVITPTPTITPTPVITPTPTPTPVITPTPTPTPPIQAGFNWRAAILITGLAIGVIYLKGI